MSSSTSITGGTKNNKQASVTTRVTGGYIMLMKEGLMILLHKLFKLFVSRVKTSNNFKEVFTFEETVGHVYSSVISLLVQLGP